jgi:hypothetical protein
MVKTIWMHVLVKFYGKVTMHFLICFFSVHVIVSIFVNIITNGLYTSEHYIVVAADSGGTLKSAYERNICYT